MNRHDLEFVSQGERCRGYFYSPDEPGEVPCVLMAHGFGGTRECGIAPFAESFCAAGYAVLLFDYRHFGVSEGEPRQLLSPWRELEDWRAALSFVRELDGVDGERIALWGTSMSGGLVTELAARDERVCCMIAQCPMMDGLASVMELVGYAGVGQALRLGAHGSLDLVRRALGMSPHYVAAAGKPGELAAMTAHDCWEGYSSLVPDGVPNRVAARIFVTLPMFRPVRHAGRVRCPALVLICEHDTIVPVHATQRAAARMPEAEVKRYPVGHFDIYHGAAFATALADQLDFLRRHLEPARAAERS